MRKILSLGIAAMLTAVAITAWATAVTRSPKHSETATLGMDVFMLMTNPVDLQVQQYDAF